MVVVRSRTIISLLVAAVLAPAAVAAQTAADRTAIGEAALSAWEHSLRSKQCAYCSRQLIFEPLVLRGWWGNGVHADTGAPRLRDSAEVARLAAALRGTAATADLVRACAGAVPKPECPVSSRTGRSVSISNPRVIGDTATLLLRDGPPNVLGNDRFIGGMTLLVSLVRVVRVNGTWTAQCMALAVTDFSPPAEQVEARCAAAPFGRGS